jgi:hypothetical protein
MELDRLSYADRPTAQTIRFHLDEYDHRPGDPTIASVVGNR